MVHNGLLVRFFGIRVFLATNPPLQTRVPALVPAIKDTGVLLVGFNTKDDATPKAPPAFNSFSLDANNAAIDATLSAGVLSFADNPSRLTI